MLQSSQSVRMNCKEKKNVQHRIKLQHEKNLQIQIENELPRLYNEYFCVESCQKIV